MANPQIIYQSKKGITLTEGYYLVRNPRTKVVSIISISKGMVHMHNIVGQPFNLEHLVHYDSTGQLEVYDSLQQTEVLKEKYKKKNKKEF